MHYQSKVFGNTQNFLFPILKVLFLMKQVKHYSYTKYMSICITYIYIYINNVVSLM